jgi:ketosteroid isomerase-like protein
MRAWTEDYENWSIDLERVIDAGEDRVVGVFHHRAIGKASGVPIELVQGIVWELADGRVVRMRNYMTPAAALEAAGLPE